MDVEGLLLAAIERVCGIPSDEIRLDTPLDDLGVDSLAVAEIIVEVEVQLDRELPIHLLRRLDRVHTVGDVVDELRAALVEPAADA